MDRVSWTAACALIAGIICVAMALTGDASKGYALGLLGIVLALLALRE